MVRPDMNEKVTITIPSHPKYLSVIRAVTAKFGAVCGMSDSVTDGIKLAVDEACSNVIKHAYKGDTGKKIVVKYIITGKSFKVVIEDNGIKSDPESMKGRDLDDLKPGGLGIHFIRRYSMSLSLTAGRKTGNRLRLIKYLKGKDED